MTSKVDYFKCQPGVQHAWGYMGKKAQEYRCWLCGVRVTKVALKEHTDA